MKVFIDNEKIDIPIEIEEEIALIYKNPEKYLYIVDYGISILLVYEEEYYDLKKWMKGYMYYPAFNQGGFVRMPADKRELTIEDKAKMVEKYLGLKPEKEEDIEKLFEELKWLYKEINNT